MAAPKNSASAPPPPPVVDALRRALAELDALGDRLREAERGIPIAEDAHRIAEAAAEAGDVAHALGRLSGEERDRRHAEARQAAEAVAAARRLPGGLRAALARAEEAVAALSADASGALAQWARERITDLSGDWQRHASALAALARQAAAYADLAGMTYPVSSACRLPVEVTDIQGRRHDLAGPAEPTPAHAAAAEARAAIRQAQRIRDRLERGQAA